MLRRNQNGCGPKKLVPQNWCQFKLGLSNSNYHNSIIKENFGHITTL
jgi:hypothetical protein